MIQIEQIEELFKNNKVSYARYSTIEERFKRNFSIFALGDSHKIEWWHNIGYVFIKKAIIPFDDIEINGRWPDEYKTHLRFTYKGNDACIIPIEEY